MNTPSPNVSKKSNSNCAAPDTIPLPPKICIDSDTIPLPDNSNPERVVPLPTKLLAVIVELALIEPDTLNEPVICEEPLTSVSYTHLTLPTNREV